MFIRDKALLNRAFWSSILRIVSVTGFSMIAAFIMVSLLPLEIADKGFVTLGLKLGAIAGVTFAVHIGISLLFGLEEAKPIINKIRTIVLRPVRI
jgi:hypothetical protein